MSWLLIAWQWLRSKVVLYGLSAAGVLLIIWRVSSGLITQGRNDEKLRQYEAQVKERKRNAEIKARNAGTSTDDLRKRMSDDWSSN